MIREENFNTPEFEAIQDKYLPATGEGENMAEQAVTAVCKLVYRWFNDGDYCDDAHFGPIGGNGKYCEDQSSYANWLCYHIDEIHDWMQDTVRNAESKKNYTSQDYTQFLYDLTLKVFDKELLAKYEKKPAQHTIYKNIRGYETFFFEKEDLDKCYDNGVYDRDKKSYAQQSLMDYRLHGNSW